MTHKSNRLRQTVLLAGLLLWSLGAHSEHYTLPLFVTSTTADSVTGVVRILNFADEPGSVEIHAIDDDGTRSGPATFTLAASAAAEFSASDLVSGNAMKGLTGGVGSLTGDVRLEIDTDLQIVLAAYVRAADGTLSTMHDTVRASTASGGGHKYAVPIFNPSTEMTHVSSLRLINPGDAATTVTIEGRDDNGTAATGTVELSLAADAAQTLTAQQLEAGDTSLTNLTGRLGAGVGKRRLTVSSDQRLQVVNVVSSTSGYMNNLSTTAVAGAAPVDHEAFNERFLDNGIEYRTNDGEFTLKFEAGDTFTQTGESDGFAVSFTGSYAHEAIGPDAGRLTLSFDDGDECGANLYFASLTGGWFATLCTGTDDPDGSWVIGNWSEVADGDDGDSGSEPVTSMYGIDEALPGVPTSKFFTPSTLVGGSVTATADGTTITLNNAAYFELSDGTRYTCTTADGCAVMNGTVTRGTVTGTSAGAGEVDRFPTFRTATNPGNQTYTAGTAIDTLTLPEASSGNGTLTYSLSPNVPGLSFNAAARQLTGTPFTAGTHSMTYTVADADGDTDTLGFTITVSERAPVVDSLGDCQVGMTLTSLQSCTYPGTADAFSVNNRGRGSFLGRLAGIRFRLNNETINGQVYDFEASHQGDGVWRIDRIAGTLPSFAGGSGPGDQTYTVGTAIDTLTLPAASDGDGTLTYSLAPSVAGLAFNATTRQLSGTPTTAGSYYLTYTVADEDGDTDALGFTISVLDAGTMDDAPAEFALHEDNSWGDGIVFAEGRIYVSDLVEDKVYAYDSEGVRLAEHDFELDPQNRRLAGITYGNGRFYVADGQDDKVYVYLTSGEREPDSDFDLAADLDSPEGIAFANGRLYVTHSRDPEKVFAYDASGQRVTDADFSVHEENRYPQRIAYGNGRFYVTDFFVDKIFAYLASGERDPSYDIDLSADRRDADAIAYANGEILIVDTSPDYVFRYPVERFDLIVGAPASSIQNPDSGTPFTLSVIVENRGNLQSSGTTLRYYRSDDSTITSSDTKIATDAVGALAAAATSTSQIELTTPTTVGTYYFGACIDSLSGEFRTENNCSMAVGITVRPDLAVSASVNDTTPASGDSFTLDATVRNAGTFASPATTLRFYRSDDRTISISDAHVATASVGALAPDGSAFQTIALPAPSTEGTYYYGACVDSVSDESSLANNCSSTVVVFGGGPFPAYDLVISSTRLNAPNLVSLGVTPIRMTVSVVNRGPNASRPAKLMFSGGTSSYLDIPEFASGASMTFDDHQVGTARRGRTTYRACIAEAPGERSTANNCASETLTVF